MLQGNAGQAAPSVKPANINSVIEDFGREIIRLGELADRARNLADRMQGGKPRDASAAAAQPESSVHMNRLQDRRAWLSGVLGDLEEQISRLESVVL